MNAAFRPRRLFAPILRRGLALLFLATLLAQFPPLNRSFLRHVIPFLGSLSFSLISALAKPAILAALLAMGLVIRVGTGLLNRRKAKRSLRQGPSPSNEPSLVRARHGTARRSELVVSGRVLSFLLVLAGLTIRPGFASAFTALFLLARNVGFFLLSRPRWKIPRPPMLASAHERAVFLTGFTLFWLLPAPSARLGSILLTILGGGALLSCAIHWRSARLCSGFARREIHGLYSACTLLGIVSLTACAERYLTTRPEPTGPRRVAATGAVYDLQIAPGDSRLYFSLKKASPPGFVDRDTNTIAWADGPPRHYERIALFPEQRRIFFGGGEGTYGFALDDLRYIGLSDGIDTIDIANWRDRELVLASEGSGTLTFMDLATGGRRDVNLPGAKPYALAVSRDPAALFVSSWYFGAHLYRTDEEGRAVQSPFLGYNAMDLCAMPEDHLLFVAMPLYRTVEVLDDRTLQRLRTLPSQFYVREIECDAQDRLVITLTHFGGRLEVLDALSGTALVHTSVGRSARALRYDGSRRTIYAGSKEGIFSLSLDDVPVLAERRIAAQR